MKNLYHLRNLREMIFKSKRKPNTFNALASLVTNCSLIIKNKDGKNFNTAFQNSL